MKTIKKYLGITCLTFGFFALISVLSFSVLKTDTVWACPLPVITLTGSPTMNLTVGDTFVDPGATATGAYTGDVPENLTPGIVVSGTVDTTTAGTYTLTYTITVISCNSSVSRQVIVAAAAAPENTPPTITILGANPLTIDVNATFTDPGATATDAEDGDLTSKIITTGTVVTTTIGSYTVTYTVTDKGGLTTTATRTVNVVAPTEPATAPLSIIATAITCANESDLPNWGDKGPAVNSSTASSYVVSHPSCHLVSNWDFQWGLGSGSPSPTAEDPGGSFIGPVTGSDGGAWHTFGPTNASGIASASVGDLHGAGDVWIRENLPAGYLGFSEPPINAPGHKNSFSAETYCASDVLNYDNYDAIYGAVLGNTYYCVAFNTAASSTPAANTPPTITLLGANPLTVTVNTAFTDPGATATDTEDGNLTSHIITSGTVSTTTVGTYTVTYTVTDSGGLTATSTRTVNVVSESTPPSCSIATTTLFSGTSDQVDGHGAVAVTYHNPAWTASIPGATWIWSVDPVANPLMNETSTFTRTFSLSTAVSSGLLEMASDNSFSVSLNGHALAADPGEFNYATAKQYVIDPSWFVVGTNTLTFTVTNFALSGSNYQTNPAGLLYELSIGPCGVTPAPAVNNPPVITILGNNPFELTLGDSFTDPGATATDTEDGNLTSKIISTSTVSTTTIGSYTITYTVTDSGGLTSTSTRVVDVNAVPVITPAIDNGGGGGGNGGANIGMGGGYGTPLFASSFGGGTVNPASATLSCPLLNDYLRYGYNNNPVEVVKLQAFLQRTEGYDVDVNGTFDQKTLSGVNAFQTKYLGQVMGPWGATQSSGYVYITTKKMINEIACNTAFIINASEQTIIDAYKAAQAENGGTPGNATTSPGIGFNANGTLNVAGAASALSGQNTATAANAPILARFWSFIMSLLHLN